MFTTSAFGKLRLWQTFTILSIIGIILASIPTWLYTVEAGKALGAYQSEQAGMPAVADALKTIQLTQQHRGLSALALGGVASAGDKRAEKQREAEALYARIDDHVKAVGSRSLSESWAIARRDWESLHGNVSGKRITIPESYQAHVQLLAKLLKINELLGDFYGLSLDPDKDSYQLIQATYYQLPALTEELGQLRAKGGGLLVKNAATTEDRQAVSMIIARVSDRLDQTSNAFGKAASYNPEIASKLGQAMDEATSQAKKLIALATAEIVAKEELSYDAPEYVAIATRAIDAQFAVNAAARIALDAMFVAKIRAFHVARWSMLGAMFALLAVAGAFAVMVTRAVTVPLNNAIVVAQSVARGNLVNDFDVGAPNEVGQMLRALKDMNDSLRAIVGDVRGSIDNINAATRDIAVGNADISARLESQASNLEETASSMEELTSTVRQNAENARQANELVQGTALAASKGGDVVSQVVHTMGEINDGSRKIVDIIAVIDGIAFQTNILALNAAVEAARAGEQGRGFAVVASEVRNLAQRSASAAKEIKELIGRSVERVEAGNHLVDQAGIAMGNILSSVTRITQIMQEIATASAEQGAGIEQINDAVTQMDDMTQQNAALVEQTAAASASLKDQASSLVASMSIFVLGNEEPQTRRPALSSAPEQRARLQGKPALRRVAA
ncbi:MAG: methyl-accepting chemotaxis protein [Pseudomonadota bacterium]